MRTLILTPLGASRAFSLTSFASSAASGATIPKRTKAKNAMRQLRLIVAPVAILGRELVSESLRFRKRSTRTATPPARGAQSAPASCRLRRGEVGGAGRGARIGGRERVGWAALAARRRTP